MLPARYLPLVIVVAQAMASARAQAPPAAYSVVDLGKATGTGAGALGVNNFGQVALRLGGTGYVWYKGTLSPAGGLPNNNTSFAINQSGHGAWTSDLRAVYWDGRRLTTLPQLEDGPTSGRGLNDSDVVGGDSYRGT